MSSRASGRSVIRFALIAALLGACFALAPQAEAASHAPASTSISVHAAANPPAGPSINQRQKDADAAQSRTKAILGVACLVLLVLIYFGRRSRRKHRKRLGDLQNAKA